MIKTIDIFKRIQEIAKKGYAIEYNIIDQCDNGYKKQVDKGEMSSVTYSVFVMALTNLEAIHTESFDALEDGLKSIIRYTEDKLLN